MIDLRRDALPSWIESDGRLYKVRTSFRVWVEFERRLREEGSAWAGIFEADAPEGEWAEAAVEFLESPNATPKRRQSQRDAARAVDLVLDGELIVASFQQAYGIDLTSEDMHWHRFKALLGGLPDDTVLREVAGFRCYKTPSKSKNAHDEAMRQKRSDWSLPEPGEDEARAAVLAWADEFFQDGGQPTE